MCLSSTINMEIDLELLTTDEGVGCYDYLCDSEDAMYIRVVMPPNGFFAERDEFIKCAPESEGDLTSTGWLGGMGIVCPNTRAFCKDMPRIEPRNISSAPDSKAFRDAQSTWNWNAGSIPSRPSLAFHYLYILYILVQSIH